MFFVNCHGETNGMARIVGGKDVIPSHWKYWNFIVAIYKPKDVYIEEILFSGTQLSIECAGSIISKWYVLTAANCMTTKEARDDKIFIASGTPNLDIKIDLGALDKKSFAEKGLLKGEMFRKIKEYQDVSHELYYFIIEPLDFLKCDHFD